MAYPKLTGSVLIPAICVTLALMSKTLPTAEAGDFDFRCLNKSIETPQLITANNTCATELNLTNVPHYMLMKNMCMNVCVLKKVGVITAADALSPAGVATFIDATYPEAARAELKTGILACGTTKLAETSKSDAACGKFRPMLTCVMKAKIQPCMTPKLTTATGSIASNPGPMVQMLTQSNSTSTVHTAVHPKPDVDGCNDDEDGHHMHNSSTSMDHE